MNKFDGRVVVVTGAASGIGAAASERFALEGAQVIAVDVDESAGELLENTHRARGHSVQFYRASVDNEEQVTQLFDEVRNTYGRLDVLFNNAGIGLESFTASTPYDEWRHVLAVNLDGNFLMSRAAIQLMLRNGRGGAIVNTSSICGHIGIPGAASYNASKHAIEGLTKTLALEHARDGIRVNSVCPGYVNTPMGRADVEADPTIPNKHPMGRIAEPSEVAAAVAFLASDEASFITGTSLLVDGGYTAM